MTDTYYVTYYIDREPREFAFTFNSQFAAVYKARMIRDAYGLATDVMMANTGEIIAIFEPNGRSWVAESTIEPDARKICVIE